MNWQMKDVKISRCPLQCSTFRVEDKRNAKIQKSMTSQINACWLGAFPTMAEEDKDESPHMDTDETDEQTQDTGLAFDDNLDSDVIDFTIEKDDHVNNLNTTQTLEYTKNRYNVKIRNKRVSPKVLPTTYIGRRMK
jgi:hypothetical protein